MVKDKKDTKENEVAVDKPIKKLSLKKVTTTEAPVAEVNEADAAAKKLTLKKPEQEAPEKITLRRKTLDKLQLTGTTKKDAKKTVAVEVRKKHTYVKGSILKERARAEEEQRAEEERKDHEQAQQLALEAAQRAAEEAQAAKPAITPTVAPVVLPQETKKEQVVEKTAEKILEKKKVDLEEILTEETDTESEKKKKLKSVKDEKKREPPKKIDLRKINLEEEGEEDRFVIPHKVHQFEKPKQAPKFLTSRIKVKKQEFTQPTSPIVREVIIPENITVAELANRMSLKATEVIKVLMKNGVIATINQSIDRDTASIVVEELGHKVKVLNENALEESLLAEFDYQHAKQVTRPPVVTIMGHVDHGKTSLLDYIRRSKLVDKEAGGITQNIGAYHVQTDRGVITFLDTPGHEAFTAMRARGADVTDIVVLVVAADDSVMPQTIEAIKHAKAAEVPIVVAVNKIDKPEADPEKVRTELTQHGVVPEEWGGESMFVNISAKTGQGVDNLLEAISLQAEMLELTAAVDAPAKGVIIEAHLDKGRGPVAATLVQQGTLKKGDVILVGTIYGRVRALIDELGHKVNSAGPSIPVELIGLPEVPTAGSELIVVSDERKAKEVALFRENKLRNEKLAAQKMVNLENIFENIGKGEVNSLNIIVKAGVQGSVEALADALAKLSGEKVKVKIVATGVGAINESDVNLALASKAIIVAFNVRADATAKRIIAQEGIDVHYHSIIYDAIDEVKRALTGLLAPEYKEEVLGMAKVREVFRSHKAGAIAGCLVTEGTIKRNKPARVLRDNVVIFEGTIDSLRHQKDNISEAREGTECGLSIKNYTDVRVGDQIEVFDKVRIESKL